MTSPPVGAIATCWYTVVKRAPRAARVDVTQNQAAAARSSGRKGRYCERNGILLEWEMGGGSIHRADGSESHSRTSERVSENDTNGLSSSSCHANPSATW